MELRPKVVQFEAVWCGVKDVMTQLLTGEVVKSENWNEKLLNIYHVCISPMRPTGLDLHREVKTFLQEYVGGIFEKVDEFTDAYGRLREYFRHWQLYNNGVNHFNLLFCFLNSYVVKKQKYSEVNIDFSRYGIYDYEDHLFEIGELACDIWERQMVLPQADALVDALLGEIQKDRTGENVDRVVIKGVISSFVLLLRFKARRQLSLYEDLFEIPFFKSSSTFFVRESQRLLENCDCSEFMDQILRRMNEEDVRCHNYVNPSSLTRISLECRERLLTDNVDYINRHCREMLQSEKWHDLGNMYQLLSLLENGLELMASEFERHLQDRGLRLMQSIQGDDTATQFVESNLQFYEHYKDKIKNVFQNNPRFLSALDKACAVAMNYRPTPKAVCKCPELLAKYCDKLLRRGTKGKMESDMDENFTQIMTLFNFIDDKDVYQRFYSRFLARRLIFHLSISIDAEEAMISRMKQSCGYEYTHKFHRMFTDMSISSDLNAKFNKFLLNNPARKLTHNFSVHILQADGWPISYSNLPTFNYPPELEKFINEFECFYKGLHSGRKLIWMYNLSLIDIKFCYLTRPYVVTMEMPLMCVLLQFNNLQHLSYQEVRENCQLSQKELIKQIQILINAKIVESEGAHLETSLFRLNLKFTNKRTKFNVLPTNQMEAMHEEEQMLSNVEADRRVFLQASIVRTMKARRELKHVALVEEVLSQTKSRFVARVAMIKKSIEVLVEKQYLKRAETDDNTYVYIA